MITQLFFVLHFLLQDVKELLDKYIYGINCFQNNLILDLLEISFLMLKILSIINSLLIGIRYSGYLL